MCQNGQILTYIKVLVPDDGYLSFRQLVKYCQPELTNKDILLRNTLRTEILHCACTAEERIWKKMKVNFPQIPMQHEQWQCRNAFLPLEPLSQGVFHI